MEADLLSPVTEHAEAPVDSVTEMNRPGKRTAFSFLLLASFLLFNGAFVIDQAIRWTDWSAGMLSGLILSIGFAFIWVLLVLPISLAFRARYQMTSRPRRWAMVLLAPSLAWFLLIMSGLFTAPPHAASSFRRFTKADLPEDSRNFRANLWGGGIADYANIYYFETSPANIGKLILVMRLEPDRSFDPAHQVQRRHPNQSFDTLEDNLDFRTLPGTKRYYRNDSPANRYYELFTDESGSRVIVTVSSI